MRLIFRLFHNLSFSKLIFNHVRKCSYKPSNLPFEQCLFIDQNGKNQGQIRLKDIQNHFPFDPSEFKLRIVNQNPPTCRLVRIADYLQQNSSTPGVKIKDKDIYFGTATSDHDLRIKCSKISPWLTKKYNVRIIVEKKGAIAEQRPKETILKLVLKHLEGEYQQIGKEMIDENRIIFSVKGLGIEKSSE